MRSSDKYIKLESEPGLFHISDEMMNFLEVKKGDSVILFSNTNWIDNLDLSDKIFARYCRVNNIDANNPETIGKLHELFGQFAIGKGFMKYDSEGKPLKRYKNLTEEEKEKYVRDNYEKMVTAVMESGNMKIITDLADRFRDKNSRIQILKKYVVPPSENVYVGSPVEEGNIIRNKAAWRMIYKKYNIENLSLCAYKTDTDKRSFYLNVWNGYEYQKLQVYILRLYKPARVKK